MRYKGAYGGRGGAKSHFFAERVIKRCIAGPARIVCIREVQNSIRDSVRQLLVDKIKKLGLSHRFDITASEIRETENGGLITFRGMQSYNAENIKSLENYNVAWVEEAQTLSALSLKLLRPTMRADDSELWFSWNPRYKTDPVDMFFRKNPPPNAVSVSVNYSDNPWLPDVLKDEIAHDFAVDPEGAEHVWNGGYRIGEGTVLAKWMARAEREGRIHDGVHYDPDGAPVFISSDIGFRDTASWWFWQPVMGGFKVFDYDEDRGLDANDWIPRIEKKLKSHGIKDFSKIWLPTDAKAKTFQSKHSSVERFIGHFGGGHMAITPPSKKPDQIAAARDVVGRIEFNKTRCELGIDGLNAWEFEYNEESGVFSREPLHNWASHPGDAFAYGCQIATEQQAPSPTQTEAERLAAHLDEPVTLETLWQDHATQPTSTRI